ncbi:MAG: hypothetical protein SF339_14590, partial [Blastocatellia bacterium]|nr:hypothetical protein [Blastocatellia bacterium]
MKIVENSIIPLFFNKIGVFCGARECCGTAIASMQDDKQCFSSLGNSMRREMLGDVGRRRET